MLARIEAGEQGRQRRPRPAGLGDRPGELYAFDGQSVDHRSRRPVIAVGAQVVGAQAIDDQKEDVRRRPRVTEKSVVVTAAKRQQQHQYGCQGEERAKNSRHGVDPKAQPIGPKKINTTKPG